MELSNLPSNPAQITKELVKASYQIEKTRLNYEAVLQQAESIVWTRENINEDLLAPAKFVAAKLTEKKDKDKRPFIDAGKVIQNEHNDVFNPLNDAISRKAFEKKQLADVIQKEKDVADAEIRRISNIDATIFKFILTVTEDISMADNDKVIAAIEMRIGSETTRKNIYQEKIKDLKQQCENLRPLIKKQKEYIRTLNAASTQQKAAEKSGDEARAVELREKADEIKEFIDENKIRIQQKALEQIENNETYVGEPTDDAPSATRSWWKWRVDDVKLLSKKLPSLTMISPNKEAIDALLAEKRDSGELKGMNEFRLPGLTFYLEKSYK